MLPCHIYICLLTVRYNPSPRWWCGPFSVIIRGQCATIWTTYSTGFRLSGIVNVQQPEPCADFRQAFICYYSWTMHNKLNHIQISDRLSSVIIHRWCATTWTMCRFQTGFRLLLFMDNVQQIEPHTDFKQAFICYYSRAMRNKLNHVQISNRLSVRFMDNAQQIEPCTDFRQAVICYYLWTMSNKLNHVQISDRLSSVIIHGQCATNWTMYRFQTGFHLLLFMDNAQQIEPCIDFKQAFICYYLWTMCNKLNRIQISSRLLSVIIMDNAQVELYSKTSLNRPTKGPVFKWSI